MRTLLPALLAVALVACNADNITAVPEPVSPVATDVWAGGTVTLHSHAFTSPDTLPVVLLAGDTLPVSLTDTFVASVELPDTVSGPLTLSVLNAAVGDTQTVTVTAHGFVRAYPGPDLAGLPQRTPDGTILAVGTRGVALVNPRDATATPLLQTVNDTSCTLTPGLSLVPDVILGTVPQAGGCSSYYAWSLATGTPAIVDSTPLGNAWVLAYLGPNRWIGNGHHLAYTMTDTSWTGLHELEEPLEFISDPTGRYLVPSLSWTNDSTAVPVYRTATSSIAYGIPGQHEIGGAGFSRGGDTLFVAGIQTVTYPSPNRLLALDAATGQILNQAPFDGLGSGYMVVEPDRPWIYVLGNGRIPINGTTGGTIGVEVIDRRTLAVVAHIQVPASAPQLIVWYDILYPVLGTNNTLYLVDITAWRNAPAPTRIFEFDLLP